MAVVKEIIKDHIEYKKQIFQLAKADLIRTYRGSALGWLWAIIKPTITIFVYWFAFAIGLRVTSNISEFPFFLWLLAGIIPWFYMNEMLTQGTDCIRKNSYLVTKMKFPVSVIPTFVNVSKLIINLILIGITVVIFAMCGYEPTIYLLQLPIYILFMFILFNFWSLFAGLISAISKDFSNLVKSFTIALFWLSGIIWNIDKIDILWLKQILIINPITYIVTGFRNCFIEQRWFWEQPIETGIFVVVVLVMMALSIWAYKKLRKEIPDVL